MFKLVRQKVLLKTARKTLENAGKRFTSSKDGKFPPMCAEPSPPPPNPSCPQGPEPPPCPPPPPPCGPPCPPPICTAVPDPNNPCNYVPPANPDPDEPDMTRVKRRQCLYQQDDGIPIYLKGGRHNVYIFHFLTILGGVTFLEALCSVYPLFSK